MEEDEDEEDEDDSDSLGTRESEESLEPDDDKKHPPPAVVSISHPAARVMPPQGPPPPLAAGLATTSSNYWMPLYIKCDFTDDYLKKHQGIIFCLPSGVGVHSSEDFKLSVVESLGRFYLKITLVWPSWASHLKFMPKLEKNMKKRYKNILAIAQVKEQEVEKKADGYIFSFASAVKETMKLMRSSGESEVVHSTGHIGLDFAVEKRLTANDYCLIGCGDGVRLVVVDLKAKEEATQEQEAMAVDVDEEEED